MLGLFDPIYASAGIPADGVLDSNLRFFGGVCGFRVLEIVGAPLFVWWQARVARQIQ